MLRRLLAHAALEFGPLCAALGGILAQQIIGSITAKVGCVPSTSLFPSLSFWPGVCAHRHARTSSMLGCTLQDEPLGNVVLFDAADGRSAAVLISTAAVERVGAASSVAPPVSAAASAVVDIDED